jgi:hypothetical protein
MLPTSPPAWWDELRFAIRGLHSFSPRRLLTVLFIALSNVEEEMLASGPPSHLRLPCRTSFAGCSLGRLVQWESSRFMLGQVDGGRRRRWPPAMTPPMYDGDSQLACRKSRRACIDRLLITVGPTVTWPCVEPTMRRSSPIIVNSLAQR